MFKKINLYVNTIRYLKFSQLYWQVRYRLYRSKPKNWNGNIVLSDIKNSSYSWLDKRTFINNDSIHLLNLTRTYNLPSLWSDHSVDDLWLFNVHYFDFLNNSKVDQALKFSLVNDWIANFDQCSMGWQAYPVSLRIVNWIKWLIENNITDKRILTSLFSQCQFLAKNLELNILGNHLFANIKALVLAGLFFDGKLANRWHSKFNRLLSQQLIIQILPHGGHFELSPMYHNIILEDLLDILSFYKIYQKEPPINFSSIIKKMLLWSQSMSHPDGEVAFFNDSSMRVAAVFEDLMQYARRCGLNVQTRLDSMVDCDGYFVVKKSLWDFKFDVAGIGASYQPGHAHADVLSFELSAGCQRLFVNSGISTYHDINDRLLQRSTQSHNALIIDGHSSSQVWSKFRVANRAKVVQRSANTHGSSYLLQGAHDGYRCLHKSLLHRRKVTLQANEILIDDFVTGGKEHLIQLRFYLHPNISIISSDGSFVLITKDLKIIISSNLELDIVESHFFPSFNVHDMSKCLVVSSVIKNEFHHQLAIKRAAH